MPPFFIEDMTDAQKAEYFSFLKKTKGGHTMSCEHKRIKSENCVISCMDCGAILPIDYIVAKERIAAQKAAEPPAEQAAEPEAPKAKGRKRKA